MSEWTSPPSLGTCILCEKQTKSHAVYLKENEGVFSPGTAEDYDFVYAICHSCFEEVDGNAETVAARTSHGRDDMLVSFGITSNSLITANMSPIRQTERVKALGKAPVKDMIDDIEPGDVFEINDNKRWVIIPSKNDLRTALEGVYLEHTMITVDDTAGSGGLVTSRDHLNDEVYFVHQETENELEFEPIETLELIGHIEDDLPQAANDP